jgi:urease accessory protein
LSVYGDDAGVTRLKELRQSGSSKLVFPKTYGDHIEVILVNTAGGITGGDRFSLEIEVEKGATLTVTTQAAERAYRAQKGEIGRVNSALNVCDGASLKWLPQELILFDRSALQRHLDINLGVDACLLMVEAVVFGRDAMPEVLRDILFQDRIAIARAGRPLYRDGMDLNGDASAHLARRAIANGAGAMASVVMVSPDAERQLAPVRALLPDTAGASLLTEDILVIRQLATDSFELRQRLIPILQHLSNNTLPTSWSL